MFDRKDKGRDEDVSKTRFQQTQTTIETKNNTTMKAIKNILKYFTKKVELPAIMKEEAPVLYIVDLCFLKNRASDQYRNFRVGFTDYDKAEAWMQKAIARFAKHPTFPLRMAFFGCANDINGIPEVIEHFFGEGY